MVTPIHVRKVDEDRSAELHLKTEKEAGQFYLRSKLERRFVCWRFNEAEVIEPSGYTHVSNV